MVTEFVISGAKLRLTDVVQLGSVANTTSTKDELPPRRHTLLVPLVLRQVLFAVEIAAATFKTKTDKVGARWVGSRGFVNC